MKCKTCGRDIIGRRKGTKYCSSTCSSKAGKKNMEEKYGKVGKIQYEVALKRDILINLKGGECYFCGNKNKSKMNIHHLTYKNNELSNILLLCRKCHSKIHFIQKRFLEAQNGYKCKYGVFWRKFLMADIAGFAVPGIPSVNIVGWISNTWIWVAIIGLVGFFLVAGIAALVFFLTYKHRLKIFIERNHELIPVKTVVARTLKLGHGGKAVIKTLWGDVVSAYCQKVGKEYWFIRGEDGYLYNFVLDKYGKPKYVSGDMRMFHIAVDRMTDKTYGKSTLPTQLLLFGSIFIIIVVLILGNWFIISKIGKVTAPLAAAEAERVERDKATLDMQIQFMNHAGAIVKAMGYSIEKLNLTNVSSGLVPAG